MKSFYFNMLLISLSISISHANLWNPQFARSSWKLIWSDEFDGPAGSPPNSTNWNYNIGDTNGGGNGWGNSELEYYTNSTENSRHDGKGNLVIEARLNTDANLVCYYGPCNYTSARLTTARKFSYKYGRVEAKIKIPRGQGIWPAFWMLGNGFLTGKGWPACGEIDIMENIGNETLLVHGTLHSPGYHPQVTYNSTCPLADGFHRYGVLWNETEISWYVDDVAYGRLKAMAANSSQWVFNDDEFFLLLNVAVGGTWPGNPDASTVFPQQMVVDYVRVYQQKK